MKPERITGRPAWLGPWPLLVLFVFTIPWEKSVWVPSVGSIARFIGLAAFAARILTAVPRPNLRRPNAALFLAAAFVLWSAATYLWSYDRVATRLRLLTLVELLAMAWLIWDVCRGPGRQLQLVGAYVCGCVAGSAMAFWRYFHHSQTYYLRYAARGFDPNDFGLILAIGVPMAFSLVLRGRGWTRWCWLLAVVVIISAILLTASRAATVATFVAMLFAVLTWRRADWAYRIATAALILGFALSLVRFAPAPQRKRIATVGTEIVKGTLHNRTHIWKAGLRALRRRPIRGVGAGAYPKAVEPWLGRPNVPGFQYVAHNTFLSVLVECGAIGFAIWGSALAVLAFFIWSLPFPQRVLWAVVAAVWAVGVSTLTWEHYKATWLIMALIMTEWAGAGWAEWKRP